MRFEVSGGGGALFFSGDDVIYANPIADTHPTPPRADLFHGHIDDLASLHLARGTGWSKMRDRYFRCNCGLGDYGMRAPPECPPVEESCPRLWLHGTDLGRLQKTESACAMLESGALQCFNFTDWWEELQLQRDEERPPAVPGPFVEYLRPDGSKVGTVTKLTVGGRHGCWLDPDDTIWCFGANDFGQLGQNTIDDELHTSAVQVPITGEIVDIEAMGDLTCALTADGTVTCWGVANFMGYPTPPFELSSIGPAP